MEALTAASVSLLTIYDMLKAIDRGMVIDGVRLLEKHGGKSGSWMAWAVKKTIYLSKRQRNRNLSYSNPRAKTES